MSAQKASSSRIMPPLSPIAAALYCLLASVEPVQSIPRPLADTDWNVSSYRAASDALDLTPVLADTTISVKFGDDGSQIAGDLEGNAGCNTYFGRFRTDIHTSGIVIDQLGWTEMGCIEPDGIMEQESAYLDALQQSTSYAIYGDKLEFYNDAGSLLVSYIPSTDEKESPTVAPPPPVTPSPSRPSPTNNAVTDVTDNTTAPTSLPIPSPIVAESSPAVRIRVDSWEWMIITMAWAHVVVALFLP